MELVAVDILRFKKIMHVRNLAPRYLYGEICGQ